ncbi:MAG: membrane protein insertase YidC [Gammaproteobacteria bacterium]|nr:membrane protein insertase YidC [Gammaproteobacteria bacterium]MBU1777811.1 membrane protein insertase YidC [Gammaproteobacteria bacterium]
MGFQRLFLFLIFSFSLIVLWNEWLRQNQPPAPATTATAATDPSVPAIPAKSAPQATAPATVEALAMPAGKKITVTTDTLRAEINTAGGNLQHIDLLKHKGSADQTKPLTLFQQGEGGTYLAQSGLLGKDLPTHNGDYTAPGETFELAEGKDTVEVRLSAVSAGKAKVSKTYVFHRDSYLVDVVFEIENKGNSALTPSAYFQFVRDSNPPEGDSKFLPTYTGPAVYTDAEKFQKIEFANIEKNKAELPRNPDNGWIAMLQHYFVAAWLPQGKEVREFYTKKLDGNLFSAGVVIPTASIEPGQTARITTPLYVGPAQSRLDEIASGLGLTVDYGWLTIFATPIFWLMSHINDWVGNWGVAIILLTVLIKLAFFPLSAASYRSMAKMRVVAPKLELIKKQYGDDRERLNKVMMDLYKTEKINPLGGCLPVLIQIPVFIALYWAILSSVEMRHAPFTGWITDLSATDPYFVLPIVMGISMLIQTKLNPVPPDPMQAKMMQIMPIAFSVMFFFFPAGLVLYSIVNNILSIAQQWYINRGTEAARKGGAKA